MTGLSSNGRALYIARHGETVFNAAGRIQGDTLHTPLTRAGFLQAEAIGHAMADILGDHRDLQLCGSATGRALQTLAIISECIGLDWHQARHDERLREQGMGDWTGHYYNDVAPNLETIIDLPSGLFRGAAPGGESMAAMAGRLRDWIDDQDYERDMIIVMHGLSSRLLRGLLCGLEQNPDHGVPVANALPQGSIVRIVDGVEELVHEGTGRTHRV